MNKKPIQVLYFEDNPGDVRLMREFLREDDPDQFALIHAGKLETGLKHLVQEKPDVILLDLGLPDSQGLETFTRVQAEAPDVAIVVLTGLAEGGIGCEAVQAGAQDYLVKGQINSGLLARAICYALERKRAQEESNTKFRTLFEASPDAIVLIDPNDHWAILDCNTATCKMNGYSHDELVGQSIDKLNLTPGDPTERANYLENIRQKGVVHLETFHRRKDGSVFPIEVSTSLISFGGCEVILGIDRDISERKQQQALQEAVYQIATATETTSSLDELYAQIHRIISSVMPAENFYISLYDEAQDLLRFPYFRDAADEPYMGGIQPAKGLTAYVLRTGKPLLCTQAVHDELERQGEVKLLGVPSAIWLGVPLVIEGKTIGAMVLQHYSDPQAYGERELQMLEYVSTQVAIAINRKRTEEALADSESQLRALFASMTDAVIVYDKDGRYVTIAPTKPTNLYCPSGEMLGKTVHEILPREQADYIVSRIRASIQTGQIVNGEYTLWIDGKEVWFASSAARLSESTVLWVAHDITNRKQAQVALERAEAKYRSLFENSVEGIFQSTPAGQFITANPALVRMLGYDSQEELIAAENDLDHGFYVQPGRREEFRQRLEREGVIAGFESEIHRKDDSTIWVSENALVVRDDQGQVSHYEGTLANITERKRAEDGLRESQQLLEKTLSSLLDAVFIIDIDTVEIMDCNPAASAIFGYSRQEMLGQTTSFLHVDQASLEEFRHHLNTDVEAKGFLFLPDFRMKRKDGTVFPTEHSVIPLENEQGKRIGWVSVVRDITESKLTDEKMRYLVALLESVNDAIVASDAQSRITVWNAAAELIYGWKAEEVLGHYGLDITQTQYPENDRARMLEMIAAAGHYRGEATQVRKDGTRFPVDLSSLVLRDDNGQISGYVSVNRDISERKRAMQELERSHQQLRALTAHLQSAIEAERTHIAREIHDEFGQSMTALKMDLAWLAKRLPEGDEKIERIQGMSALVDESIALMRRVATELRPNLLDDLGLAAALDWQARDFSRHTDIPCKLNLPAQELELDMALRTSLFRIFQETLTNISRHAQATRVHASLRQKENTLILTIHDNGIGIRESELNGPRSLGLIGLRERALQWGGEMIIRGVPGKGTTVTVCIPLPTSPVKGGDQ